MLSCDSIVDESARWLASKGRTEDADRILCKMARWNGRDTPPSIEILTNKEKVSSVTLHWPIEHMMDSICIITLVFAMLDVSSNHEGVIDYGISH